VVGAFLERVGVERPVVQAGMGGGLAGHELAAAVSEAGGLGTIGILGPDALRMR
jgi:nitronate monooxygenase